MATEEKEVKELSVIPVKSTTPVPKLASRITLTFTKDKKIEVVVRAIGAGAVNQAIKGVITAKSRLITQGISVSETSFFEDISVGDGKKEKITAIGIKLSIK